MPGDSVMESGSYGSFVDGIRVNEMKHGNGCCIKSVDGMV